MYRKSKLRQKLNSSARRRPFALQLEKLEERYLMASDTGTFIGPINLFEQPGSYPVSPQVVARIINGTVTNAYPSVGQMGFRINNADQFIGSGVLIAPQYVLTAAHVAIEGPSTAGRVLFGTTTYTASQIFIHPSYNAANLGEDTANDIAIYRLDTPVTNITPSPIMRVAPTVGSLMTLVGFGGAGTGQTGSDGTFGTKRVGTTTLEQVTPTLLRWTFDVGSSESNTAPGDSGGPSYIDVAGVQMVAGITSGGQLASAGWGDRSFNTRVDAYQSFIDGIVNGSTIEYAIANSTYAQNFNTLASANTSSILPTGWFLAESGTNANATYTANNGASSTGETYSYGVTSSTERALGGLQSGSLTPSFGAAIRNTTGSPLTSLTIGYTGEQWRLGTVNRPDRLDFQYSFDATSLTTGTWTNLDALDFVAPTTTGTVGALDGNSAANRSSRSATINSINLANNATMWVRWTDFNASGADDGLAIDDFTLVAQTASANTAPTISTIADQSTPFQTSIAAIPFTIGDAETPAASLVVTAASSNTALIPLTGIILGGTGANRTVSITPASGQSGTSTITLTVSDGALTSIETFVVTVVAGITETVNLRFVTYNIAAAGSQGVRAGLSTVLAGIGQEIVNGISRPIDLLALQEVESQATTSSIVVAALNNLYSTTAYVSGTLNGTQLASNGVQFGMTQGVVYNSTTLQLLSEIALGTPSTSGIARQVMRYLFRPVGTSGSSDFYVYNSHYKAVDDAEGRQRRLVEANLIRSDADSLGDGRNIIYMGDFNTYTSTEAGYERLLSAGAGQAFDPINRPGSWSGGSTFRSIFTQSPAVNPPDSLGLVGGGLDDRFDFQLVSGELLDTVGLDILPTSYRSFGINGSLPLNAAINDSRNTALSGLPNRSAVLNALAVTSDHVPVVADYRFTRAVANAAPTDITLSAQSVVENAPLNTRIGILSTSDPNPLDTFTYTLVAGVGGEDNARFSIVGNELRVNAAVDFELTPILSVRIRATDQGGLFFDKVFEINVTNIAEATVQARRIFYNRSTSTIFGNGAGNPINSIASDKVALLPGQAASNANYTNYLFGINGLLIDVSRLNRIATSDLQFDAWDGVNANGFQPMQVDAVVTVIRGGGLNGSDRIKIEFPDYSIQNTWLRVTVLANAANDLVQTDVFYFGNATGDVGLGNSSSSGATVVSVNSIDFAALRSNQSISPNSVGIENAFDINKDGRVNSIDTAIARAYISVRVIRFITAPPILRTIANRTTVGDSIASNVVLKEEDLAISNPTLSVSTASSLLPSKVDQVLAAFP